MRARKERAILKPVKVEEKQVTIKKEPKMLKKAPAKKSRPKKTEAQPRVNEYTLLELIEEENKNEE